MKIDDIQMHLLVAMCSFVCLIRTAVKWNNARALVRLGCIDKVFEVNAIETRKKNMKFMQRRASEKRKGNWNEWSENERRRIDEEIYCKSFKTNSQKKRIDEIDKRHQRWLMALWVWIIDDWF